ncbi:MAG: MFS transporter, PPP family, 3-phenylpropionic acid transporter [Candidatus Kentron sp. G]|nr:MAG: MFS transporter, PPP family, 3-phenylpropionic acid transporter [Candidatus Kentron sp. G]VFN06058.1 MAG: MFS transporter, PPP family, 3-phenylpropionic acid transporter [Candidatus Kentron sp. G]
MRKKLLDTFGAQVSSDHERYPADVKCLGFLYLYVGRYPRNNASRNTIQPKEFRVRGTGLSKHFSRFSPTSLPYWPLSGFYFFYFATVGILMPYLGLYLQSLGFCPRQIGAVIAILATTKIVAPIVWGRLADRRSGRVGIVRTGAIISVIAFTGAYFSPDAPFWLFVWWVLVAAVFGFFWNASLPQVEAITLSRLGEDTHRYARIRLWGSIGFILTVLLFGELFERYELDMVLHGTLVLLIGLALSTALIPEHAGKSSHPKSGPIGAILKQPRVIALLVACFLMQVSHGPLYAFYSIYLDEHLYESNLIGKLWAVSVCAEVVLFMVMARILKHVGLRSLFLSAFAVSALRWLLVAFFPMEVSVQVFAQLLHAITFGVFHKVAILLTHRFFAGNHQGQGQALYNSAGFGAGYAAGALGGGFLWFHFDGYTTYLAAAGVSIVAFFIVWRWLDIENSH